MNLVPLYEEAIQFNNFNGTVLAAGKVEVWYLGRTRKADIYADVAGETPLPNPLDLNDLGMQEVYVNPAFNYTLVVYDPYGSELFSVDKYLQGAGAHTTSNVVVQPSEHIGVSAWTVGEVQIYQPYLTGQLGKVYTGIEPIVVNNVEDKISANHVPLGVQDPLYFVQDDEEGCIIGLSGGTVPEGTMNESAFGYQDGQITSYNGSAFSAGNSYEAGSYVDIDGNTINVTGLQPAGNYQSAGDYVVHDELSSYATEEWVENQSYMKEYMESAFYPMTGNPSGFLTAHQDISNKLDTTAFSTVSGDFLTAIPSEYVTENTLQSGLSSKLDSTAFSTVSGNFLTAHQSLDGLMSASLLEQSGGLITGYNGTAFAGQGGGGVTGDFTLVEGNGIQLTDDPIAQTTTISVSGDYATNTQLQNVSADITAQIPTDLFTKASADTLYQPIGNYLSSNALEGYATENWVTSQGFITNDAITGKQDITGMTAYQPVGDYLTTGDSAEFMTTAERSDYIPTGVSSEFYTTANTANYISEVPDTYLQNTDLEISDNKITGISGVPLAAGGELPESVSAATDYVTANSATINGTVETVSANSGAWGGSALPISAGPGIKFELVDNTLVASTQGPILDEITTAGTWNGREVKQMLLTGTFSTNVNSDVIPVNSAYSAYERKWIDPSNSFIFYGSSANILPSTWVLGATGRLGSLSLLNGIVRARSNDTTNTPCTAFVTIKWCED